MSFNLPFLRVSCHAENFKDITALRFACSSSFISKSFLKIIKKSIKFFKLINHSTLNTRTLRIRGVSDATNPAFSSSRDKTANGSLYSSYFFGLVFSNHLLTLYLIKSASMYCWSFRSKVWNLWNLCETYAKEIYKLYPQACNDFSTGPVALFCLVLLLLVVCTTKWCKRLQF